MLTHVGNDGRPGMVDVDGKMTTSRTATAESIVVLPPEVAELLDGKELQSKKGPVFQTAIIAGTMAAKRTQDLIPLCHQVPLVSVKFDVSFQTPNRVSLRCTAKARYVTGVEMEALTGATVAALTVYDMCKALSRDIVIADTRLIEKKGGKSDVPSRKSQPVK